MPRVLIKGQQHWSEFSWGSFNCLNSVRVFKEFLAWMHVLGQNLTVRNSNHIQTFEWFGLCDVTVQQLHWTCESIQVKWVQINDNLKGVISTALEQGQKIKGREENEKRMVHFKCRSFLTLHLCLPHPTMAFSSHSSCMLTFHCHKHIPIIHNTPSVLGLLTWPKNAAVTWPKLQTFWLLQENKSLFCYWRLLIPNLSMSIKLASGSFFKYYTTSQHSQPVVFQSL